MKNRYSKKKNDPLEQSEIVELYGIRNESIFWLSIIGSLKAVV